MTDITDQERRDMLEWARIAFSIKGNQEHEPWVTAARYILDNVDAPEPTLAEELARIAENSPVWTIQNVCDELYAATTHAKQMERDLEEARAEVERLTAVNEEIRRTDNYREFREFLSVQKGAESNAETPDPADVKPGEAWLVEVNGWRGTAVKDCGRVAPWSVVINGAFYSRCNETITLVSRLVPAPRVITDPDELDALEEGSIVRDRAGHAWERYPDEDWYSTEELDDGFSSRCLADYAGPVTVLWEPEA